MPCPNLPQADTASDEFPTSPRRCPSVQPPGGWTSWTLLQAGAVDDGRNRYRACLAAGVTPRAVALRPDIDGSPLAYVVSRNLKRRHLSDDQRRVVAARIANLGRGHEARHVRREAESTRFFHVVRRPAASTPFRSCTCTTRLASGAAPTPGQRGQDKRRGTSRSESIEKSTRDGGVQFCAARRFSSKGSQVQRSQWHSAVEQPQPSDDGVSLRAVRPFRFEARASIITTMAFAIANRVN
jgi:hypothetical protein